VKNVFLPLRDQLLQLPLPIHQKFVVGKGFEEVGSSFSHALREACEFTPCHYSLPPY